MTDSETTREAFEQAIAQSPDERYHLRLFITGATPRSTLALTNIRAILDTYLPGRYDLEVIDLYQHPEAAEAMLVIAAPTLVKTLPPPLKRMIGDMSNLEKVLLGLGLHVAEKEPE